jgi:ribosomal protein S18 acetylase RimI-like enzyme
MIVQMSDSPPFHIRPGQASDAESIADFNVALAQETEHLALDRAIVLQGVRAALGDSAKGLYFVADAAGRVVGQLMITREWSDWRNGDFWWIMSVYVAPDFRGRGVFKSLFRHVENLARKGHAAGLRLYVEKQNTGAQKTYSSLGMRMSEYRIMEKGF